MKDEPKTGRDRTARTTCRRSRDNSSLTTSSLIPRRGVVGVRGDDVRHAAQLHGPAGAAADRDGVEGDVRPQRRPVRYGGRNFAWAFACGSVFFGFLADRLGPRMLYPFVLIGLVGRRDSRPRSSATRHSRSTSRYPTSRGAGRTTGCCCAARRSASSKPGTGRAHCSPRGRSSPRRIARSATGCSRAGRARRGSRPALRAGRAEARRRVGDRVLDDRRRRAALGAAVACARASRRPPPRDAEGRSSSRG